MVRVNRALRSRIRTPRAEGGAGTSRAGATSHVVRDWDSGLSVPADCGRIPSSCFRETGRLNLFAEAEMRSPCGFAVWKGAME